MRLFISLLVSALVFAGCSGAWWVYGPAWELESRLQRTDGLRRAELSRVTYNRSTATLCGYVRGAKGRAGWTHFVVADDGKLRLDPPALVGGSTLQQLEAAQQQADYLATVFARCAA